MEGRETDMDGYWIAIVLLREAAKNVLIFSGLATKRGRPQG